MRPERGRALLRATAWTATALPPWLLAGRLFGPLPLAAVTWSLMLGCELSLAWIQGAGYPPLGPWSWLSDTRSTVAAHRLATAVSWLRSRVPWDGIGCAAVLAGPIAIVIIVTTADRAPRLATIAMLAATAAEVCGTVHRATHAPHTTGSNGPDHPDRDQDPD
jgi:hypothetical protein